MPSKLQVLSGKSPGAEYELTAQKIRLGRHPDCEVVIDVGAVSRYHAQINREGERYFVEDLKSRNGTFVNGRKIEEKYQLKENDRLKICDTLFVFRGKPAEAPPVAAEEDEGAASTVLSTFDAQGSNDLLVRVNPESKLRAILEITQTIGQTLELDALFPRILESLFKIFPQADRALLVLRDAGDNLVPKAVKHRRDSDDSIRFSRTIVRQAMTEKKAILSADASSDSRFSMSQSLADFRIRSIMCVPLLAQDKTPLGVIQIDTQSNNQKFDGDDLQILASVATQASFSIEMADMHESQLRQERMTRELQFARQVQHSFLPKSKPKLSGYAFWAYYEAAGQVGGDYYDFVTLNDGRQAVIIGDVSGKGVPAALMMAKASSDTKLALLTDSESASHAMERINNAVCAAGVEDKFITMALCVIDPRTHRMTVVNAGHMSPMIGRSNGSIDEPVTEAVSGLPVGVAEDFPYDTIDTDLGLDEPVVLFTDGISEAMNVDNQDFTLERIRDVLRECRLPPDELGEVILERVRDHVNGHKQHDDMTLVVFSRVTENAIPRETDTSENLSIDRTLPPEY